MTRPITRKRPQTRMGYVLYATAPPKGEGPPLWHQTAKKDLWYRVIKTKRKVLAVVRALLDQGQSGDLLRRRSLYHRRGGSLHYSDRYGRDEWTFGRSR